ncbi:MAG: two-component sensor histidine kinase [Candidatus Riflebacteria bacterium]|nr:two-component sensor histidine kinase [Candidatus Riflebacteria bacterium]
MSESDNRNIENESERHIAVLTARIESVNKEMQLLAYAISHDLRTPLRAIDGFAHIIEEDYGSLLPQEGRVFFSRIRDNAERMGQMIDGLLSFSRLGDCPLEIASVDTVTLVRQLVEEKRAEFGNRNIDVRIGSLPSCQADPNLLRQAFLDLFSNAIKYTRTRDFAIIEISGNSDDRETIFQVKDNGVGFNLNYATKLFTVFQRFHPAADYEGVGIGLARTQRIVKRHGGRIWAESAPDKGAAFYFSIGMLTPNKDGK